MKSKGNTSILTKRKQEHLSIPLSHPVEYQGKTTLFEDVFLIHNALPEINRKDIEISTIFLEHTFAAPFMVTGMTGGIKKAAIINKNIAKACQKLGLGMGLGSLKAMIEDPSVAYSYEVRDIAPDIFLAGNIGANDLKKFSPSILKGILKQLGANILAVHLNPGQELVQKEGQTEFHGVLEQIAQYSQEIPIYVKEVGQGISASVAAKLATTNIKAIDIGGAGGTNWLKIEYLRQGIEKGPYENWGIPTALSLLQTKKSTSLPLIATGGIRSGEDIVKALILGASLAGIGLPFLYTSLLSLEKTEELLTRLIQEIGDIMFLLGISRLENIPHTKPILVGQLKELISSIS